jgi:tetratricopeptide (TPR) repeat protein
MMMKNLAIFVMILVASVANIEAGESIAESYTYEQNAQYNKAIEIVLKLEKNEPQEAYYKLRLGWLYSLNADYLKSEYYYTNALKIEESLEGQEGLIYSLFMLSRWDSIIEKGLNLLGKYPHHFTVLTRVAYSYYAKQNYANAAKYYQHASELYPYNLEVMGYLLDSQHKNKNLIEADKLYHKLLKFSPQNPFILTYRDIYGS